MIEKSLKKFIEEKQLITELEAEMVIEKIFERDNITSLKDQNKDSSCTVLYSLLKDDENHIFIKKMKRKKKIKQKRKKYKKKKEQEKYEDKQKEGEKKRRKKDFLIK